MRSLKQNTARSVMIFMTDITDPTVGLAGLTPTVTLSKNGAAFAAMSGAAATDRSNGWYSVPLDATDTNTLGDLALRATAAGANTTSVIAGEVVRGSWNDFVVDNGTAQAGGAATITLRAGASAVNNSYRGMNITIVGGTGANQTRMIDAYTGATKIAFMSLGWDVVPDNTSIYVISSFADVSYLKEIGALAYTATTNLDSVLITRRGIAQAAAAGSITLDASASAVDGAYVGSIVVITSGTGVNQSNVIVGYVGATKVASVMWAWTSTGVTPDATSNFAILRTASEGGDFIYPTIATPYSHTTSMISTLGSLDQTVVARRGVAQAGGAASITLDAGASAVSLDYSGMTINIINGTGSNQSRQISSYDGTTKVATLATGWAVVPDNTSVFDIVRVSASATLADIFGTDVSPYAGIGGSIAEYLSAILAEAALAYSSALGANTTLVTESGVAQAGAASSITLAAAESATNNLFKGMIIFIQNGTGAKQARIITAYDGTTKVATVNRPWATNPAVGSGYRIIPFETIPASEQADAVLEASHESGRTLKGVFRRLDALMTGKATGLLGVLATFFRPDGVTKAIEATQNTTLGTRDTASTVGGD